MPSADQVPIESTHSTPSHDTTIECQYLGFQRQQLGAKRGNSGTRHLGEPGVIWISDSFEQLLDAIAPDRRDDPELGKVRAD